MRNTVLSVNQFRLRTVRAARTNQDVFNVPGGLAGGATPVPIPNTEVKPSKADDTAAERQWESRTLPGYKKKPAGESQQAFLFCGPVQRPEEK